MYVYVTKILVNKNGQSLFVKARITKAFNNIRRNEPVLDCVKNHLRKHTELCIERGEGSF